jgi:hypothetical protein
MGVVGSSPTPGTVPPRQNFALSGRLARPGLVFPSRMVKGMFPIIVEAIRSMRLKAVRCTECGDARWCLFTAADPDRPCDLCGGEMKVERRTPGGGPRQLLRERRNAAPGLVPRPRTPLTR